MCCLRMPFVDVSFLAKTNELFCFKTQRSEIALKAFLIKKRTQFKAIFLAM